MENGLFVTAIGRVQVVEATRPWARVAWGSDKFDLWASYSGRISNQAQVLLSNGAPIDERSCILQLDGKFHSSFLAGRGRVVAGLSVRNARVNTLGTLMAAENDDRSDRYYSGFGQVEYSVIPKVRLVAAGRYDNSNLFDAQLSPKGAVVYSPTPDHAFRVTASRAFLTPSQTEYFLHIQPGVQDFSPLEVQVLLGCLDDRRSITLAGDTQQHVVEDGGFTSWSEFLARLGVDGAEVETLQVSYRCSREIADVVVFLASERGSFITGETIIVGGGRDLFI